MLLQLGVDSNYPLLASLFLYHCKLVRFKYLLPPESENIRNP